MDEKQQSEWGLFWEFIKSRIRFPCKSIAFTTYFFTIIIVVGLLASFITSYDSINSSSKLDYDNISLTLISYSLVLLCSSAIEFIFIGFKDDETKYESLKNPMTMIGIASIIVGIVLALFAYTVNFTSVKIVLSIVLTVVVWLMWWISNSRSLSVLNEEYPPKLPNIIGGDFSEKLSGSIPSDYKI